MGWFTKYNPTDIASQLHATKLKIAAPLSDWQQSVRPDAAEVERLQFSLYLLPLALCHLHCQASKKPKFGQAVEEALGIYVENYRDKNEIVTIGDYIIWGPEREAIAHILRETYFLPIIPEMFHIERIKMNILLHAAAQTRKQAAMADFQMGVNNATGGMESQFVSVMQMFAVTLSKQILRLDLSTYSCEGPEYDRFVESVPLAASMIAPLYTEIIRTIRP